MKPQETVSNVIRLKQRILQEAPASARRIDGVDKIFYKGSLPGYDAMLSASGTVSYREGWGAPSRPTRYGGVIAANRALRAKRYRPYNIFTGNEWQMNEQRHQFAKMDRQRQQQVFQPTELPKINKKITENNYLERPAGIEYPIMNIPSENNMVPRRPTRGRLTWMDLDQNYEKPERRIIADKNEMFRNFPNQQTIPAYAKSKFAAMRGMESQLGIPSMLGAAPKTKVKPKGKGK